MGTKTIANGGGSWFSNSTWVEGSIPLASDNVVATATSGNLTIGASGAVCRSIDLTGYLGILTHGNFGVSVGDATAGASNIALRFSSTMTYNKLHPTGAAFTFISTSATQQDIDSGGNILGNITFNASSNGSWRLVSNLECTKWLSTVNLTKGSFKLNGFTLKAGVFDSANSNVRTLDYANSTFDLSGIGSNFLLINTITNLTIVTGAAGSATVKINKNSAGTAPLLFVGIKNWDFNVEWIGGGIMTLRGGVGSRFNNLTVNGAAKDGIVKNTNEDRLQINEQCTILGTWTINGYSATRRLRVHSNGGVRTMTVANSTAVIAKYADFQNITLTVTNDLSAIVGGAGDLTGNTGIIFTSAITCYWYSNTSGVKDYSQASNWFLATGGTGGQARKPLPQDDARFDSNSFAVFGVIVRCDVGSEQLGKNVLWQSVTNSPTWDFQVDVTNYGSVEFPVNVTAYSSAFFTMFGSGASQTYTVKFNGCVLPHTLFLINTVATNTVVLQDDLTGNALNTTVVQTATGIVDFNGKNVIAGRFVNSSGTVLLKSGTFKMKGQGTVFSFAGTVTPATSVLEIESQDNVSKTFAGGGKTFNKLKFSGNYLDVITITGSNTFADLEHNFTSAKTILWTASTTTTITGTVSKTSGDLWNMQSTTSTAFTWSKASGTVLFDDVVLSKSTGSGGAIFTYNGISINGGGNTGWSGATIDPFTWTGASSDDWTDPSNWYGGVTPEGSDIAWFTGSYNTNALYLSNMNPVDPVFGIRVTAGYTGTITQGEDLYIGDGGLQVSGGTCDFSGWTYVYCSGSTKLFGGTLKLPLNGTYEVIPLPLANGGTFIVLGGTLTHNNSSIYSNSLGDAYFSNSSANSFYSVALANGGNSSGTYFCDFISVNGSTAFNADVSCKGNSGVLCNIGNISSVVGTGTFRFINTVSSAIVALDTSCNVQFNATNTINLGSVTILGNFTITAAPSINGSLITCYGNVSSSTSSIGSNCDLTFEGLLEQTLSGAGTLPNGTIRVNKGNGMVKLTSNMQPTQANKLFWINTRQVCTNGFNLTLLGALTIDAGAVLNRTQNSTVNVAGAISGTISDVSRCYRGFRV